MTKKPNGTGFVNALEVATRLARMEATLEGIKEHLDDQKETDGKLEDKIDKNNEKITKKIDKILENDKDKLQRIAKTETKVKNIKAILWLFLTIFVGIAVKTFLL